MKVGQDTIRSKIHRDPLDRMNQVFFTLLCACAIILRWNLHLLKLTKLLTRHKNFADSAKFTVLIGLSARDPYILLDWWIM